MLAVAPNTPARVVRVAAVLVLLAIGVSSALTSDKDDRLELVVFLGVYLLGFVAVTGRSAAVPARAVAAGAIAGVTAVALPTALFMLWPPAPVSGGWALAAAALAAVVAGAVTGARQSEAEGMPRQSEAQGTPRLSEAGAVVFAGLLAAIVVALLLPMVVSLLAQVGPESWVPRLTSHALTPASRLAERRELAGENYLRTLLIGDLLALTAGLLVLQVRRWARRPATTTMPAQTIELIR